MTEGIERLRRLAREQEEHSWSSVGKVRARVMMGIAAQIEREQTDELLRRLVIVQGVVDRMRGAYSDPCRSCVVTGDVVLGWARDLEAALDRRDAIAELDAK